MPLIDRFGRAHDYLRISVTDRCNLRCIYCMGPEGVKHIPHQEILTYEEILQIVAVGAELGIKKIRITGGEPLVRKGVVSLVEGIARIPGISDIAMTTNGILLPHYAAALKKAGLKRVNISLDSMREEVFKKITRRGDLRAVQEGIKASLEVGLQPVKINTVLMKGINHTEVADFLRLAQEYPLYVRFIEYMPIGDHDRKYGRRYLPLSYVKETAASMGLPLIPADPPAGAGPAESFTLPGGKGGIGLIHPISRHFCHSCNRLRLTADGRLKACLYWQEEIPLRPAAGDRAALRELFRQVVGSKARQHLMSASAQHGPVSPGLMRNMSKTGG
ncbi:MAG: GTP 3',8-cyclase MoaA [Firmicutes bacterium]|nr:GTP 3',8-cyclase MoaA [Bacillota bacterium]